MKDKELFQIGEVAKMFHMSVGSLRHYEKIGLLMPEYIDSETGYRYYSTRQFECLNAIRYLRVLDMPLDLIGEFINNRDIDTIQNMLEQQKELVIKKQHELQIIENKIDNRLKQIKDAIYSELNVIKIIEVKSKRIAIIKNNIELGSYLDLESSMRKLDEQSDAIVFLGKVGVGISMECLQNKQYTKYDMVFIILDDEDVYNGTTEEWPEEYCVSIRFCGEHNDAPTYYKKIIDFIKKNNLSNSGFSREITMIDYGMTNDKSQFVTEISVPIKINK